jgi:hypothetical protein
MTQYPRPNDPQPMKDAIDTLNELGVTFQRPTVYQLKIGDLSFYPGRGTIFSLSSTGMAIFQHISQVNDQILACFLRAIKFGFKNVHRRACCRAAL